MFKYLCKNKKGISLMEMIIAVTLVGFILSIAGQILSNFTRTYNIAVQRWEIQSAVHLACTKFERSRDSIVNAQEADLLYDSALDAGIVYNTETHTVTWNQASSVMPEEGFKDINNTYTYIFSVPATDQNGKYLGKFLFIRDFDAEKSVLFLDSEGVGEVPVDIAFRVAVTPDKLSFNEETQSYEADENQSRSYMKSTIEIDFKSGLEDVTNYEVITQFMLYNFGGKSLTIRNEIPVLRQEWLGHAYPAGWSQGEEISGAPERNVKYLMKTNPERYSDEDVDCSQYLYNDANMMRFVSERASDAESDPTSRASTLEMASCLTKLLFMDGTRNGTRTIGALREFRDNCLRGNAVGEWIIDEYYHSWSPALVNLCKASPAAGKVIKCVLSPLSKVLGVIAYE